MTTRRRDGQAELAWVAG